MAISSQEREKYFIFSREQLDTRKKVEETIGKKYIPGEVIVKGKKQLFTEITETPSARYKDSIVVVKGKLSEFRYTLPKSY